MKKLVLPFLLAFLCVNTLNAFEGFRLPGTKKPHRERMYIDEEELDMTGDCFHIHVGNNEWIQTKSIHRDQRGLYTYESSIKGQEAGYEKHWKCPYCYAHWPMHTKCQNPDCPSKYI